MDNSTIERVIVNNIRHFFYHSDEESIMSHAYDRDLIGYGKTPPHPKWPQDARIAVSFVLNYEEGGERSKKTNPARL
jgi:hypothetical protein